MFLVTKKFLNIARRFTFFVYRYSYPIYIYYFNVYGFTIFLLNYAIGINQIFFYYYYLHISLHIIFYSHHTNVIT